VSAALEVRLQHALPGFDLDAALSLGREIGVLFGPSGAGKSLMLRLIAGLMRPREGEVRLNGRILSGTAWVPPQERRIGYVFQHHALFPHMSVLENVVYGARGLPREKALAEARRLIQEFRLEGLEARRPKSISGGQKQRVAFARALIAKPELLLLDEPFSALDGPTRVHMRDCLARLMRSLGIPVLLVTHDLAEARSLAERMFVLIGGRVLQHGRPEEIVQEPASEAVRELTRAG